MFYNFDDMKKEIILAVATVCASAAVGGATAYSIAHNRPEPKTSEVKVETVRDFASSQTGTKFTSYSADGYPDLTYAAENAVKGVVSVIKTEEVSLGYGDMQGFGQFFEFFGNPRSYRNEEPQTRMSGGSGVIISSDGYIVTNNHVVDNASKLKVKLFDNRTFDAEIIGADEATDVALIKIDAQDLPTIPFGDSDALRLGEWVLAIGSPYELQSTVTAGIVSAKSRTLGVIPSQISIESFIQTDAAVNPGNSGGALVNTKGQLVGINTVIKSPSGSYAGYSFAVPEAIVRKVVVDLKEYGIVQRALLGVMFRVIDENFIEQEGKNKGITEIGGVYVAEAVEDGAAKAARIEKGDVITEIDGIKIGDAATVTEIIGKHRPNDKVNVTVKRDGKVKHFEVVLRNKAGKTELVSKDDFDIVNVLGGEFDELSQRQAKQLGIDGGVVVRSVKNGGLLYRARISEGFVITHINDKTVRSLSDLNRITEKVTSIDGVSRGGRAIRYALVE